LDWNGLGLEFDNRIFGGQTLTNGALGFAAGFAGAALVNSALGNPCGR